MFVKTLLCEKTNDSLNPVLRRILVKKKTAVSTIYSQKKNKQKSKTNKNTFVLIKILHNHDTAKHLAQTTDSEKAFAFLKLFLFPRT